MSSRSTDSSMALSLPTSAHRIFPSINPECIIYGMSKPFVHQVESRVLKPCVICKCYSYFYIISYSIFILVVALTTAAAACVHGAALTMRPFPPCAHSHLLTFSPSHLLTIFNLNVLCAALAIKMKCNADTLTDTSRHYIHILKIHTASYNIILGSHCATPNRQYAIYRCISSSYVSII